MSRVNLTIGIVLIFVLGGLAGGLTVQLYRNFEHRGGPPPPPPPPLERRIDFIMERLGHDLDLTPEQIARIRPLVEKTEKEITRLRDQIDPEIKTIHDQGFAAIRERLDESQQQKLDDILERFKKFHPRPPR